MEYKRYRQLYEKKDFTQDEERYEAQQESMEGKPAAGRKRQGQKQANKKAKRRKLAAEELYGDDVEMTVHGKRNA